MPPKFYAVARGRAVGVYSTWAETQPLVNGFVGARYKSFATLDEASQFVASEPSTSQLSSSEFTPSVGSTANVVALQKRADAYVTQLSSAFSNGGSPPGAVDAHAPCNNDKKLYAVARGRRVGLFSTWAEAEPLVKGYVGARYKSFLSRTEAEAFLKRESLGALLVAAAEAAKVEITNSGREQGDTAEETGDPSVRASTRIVGSSVTANNNNSYNAVLGADSSFRTAQASGVFACLRPDFPSSLEKPLVVYTDGACPNNGNAAMHPRAGYGVHYPKHENEDSSACDKGGRRAFPLPPDLSRSVPVNMKQTNNVGELMAVNAAVRQVVERDRGDGCFLGSSSEKAEIGASMGTKCANATAISLAKQRTQPLIINTDSKYCIEGATHWMLSWAKRGWRLKTGGGKLNTEKLFGTDEPDQDGYVRNVGLWQELHELLKERRKQMEDALVFLISLTDEHFLEVRSLGRKHPRSPSPSSRTHDEKESCDSPMSREKAREIAQKYAVVFNHVRGHCGIPGNEEADRLAVMGAIGMGK